MAIGCRTRAADLHEAFLELVEQSQVDWQGRPSLDEVVLFAPLRPDARAVEKTRRNGNRGSARLDQRRRDLAGISAFLRRIQRDYLRMGGLEMSGREAILKGGKSGPVIVPGSPEKSLLIEAVWAFQPVRKSEPPPVKDKAWARSAIDRFILARLEAQNLKPVRMADKRFLIRRATGRTRISKNSRWSATEAARRVEFSRIKASGSIEPCGEGTFTILRFLGLVLRNAVGVSNFRTMLC
jgi:hypothetical protein